MGCLALAFVVVVVDTETGVVLGVAALDVAVEGLLQAIGGDS